MKQAIIGLCFLGAVCFAMPQEQGRGLSLFNVVKFQNDLCAGSKKNGTCYTKAECESKGGTESGDCAQGFGVCCVISLDCGAMSNDNNTYLERTTTTDLVGSSCSYEICPANSKICRIRYDFTSHTIANPALATVVGDPTTVTVNAPAAGTVGNCNVDSFTIANNGGTSPPLICGYNDGQHMILDSDGAGCQDVLFQIGSSTGVTRKWDIVVTQHTCDEMDMTSAGPMGCLQYFTGTTGQLRSFNFPQTGMDTDGPVTAQVTHLNNQDYKICIRKEKDKKHICYAAVSATIASMADKQGSYGLSVASIAIADSQVGSACNEDYISFNGGVYTEAIAIIGAPTTAAVHRVCGRFMNTSAAQAAHIKLCSITTPFEVNVVFDEQERYEAGTAMAQLEELQGAPGGTIGFGLTFTQA